MTHYIGILDGHGDVWGVRVPDLPGCTGGGATPEAAIADAISAMREWAAHKTAKGETVPAARTLASVLADKDVEYNSASESTVMLPLILEAGKPVRANISVDAAVLAAIDEAAELRGLTRSAFLVTAAREAIERSAT